MDVIVQMLRGEANVEHLVEVAYKVLQGSMGFAKPHAPGQGYAFGLTRNMRISTDLCFEGLWSTPTLNSLCIPRAYALL
jgi:hypothetical protein